MSQKKSSESILEVHFHGIADKGQCVGKSLTGETVFAVGPVPGDKALIKVFRKRKGFYKGQVMSYLSLSANRVEPVCSHFADGGASPALARRWPSGTGRAALLWPTRPCRLYPRL